VFPYSPQHQHHSRVPTEAAIERASFLRTSPCTRTRRRGFTACSSAPGGRPVVLEYSRPEATCWCPELLPTRCSIAPLSRLSRVAFRMCGCRRTSLALQPAPIRSPRGGGRCQPRPAARSGLTVGPPAPFRRKSAHRLSGNDAGSPGGKEVFSSGPIARRGAHWPIRKNPISTAILRTSLYRRVCDDRFFRVDESFRASTRAGLTRARSLSTWVYSERNAVTRKKRKSSQERLLSEVNYRFRENAPFSVLRPQNALKTPRLRLLKC
jgi:hypothetical protein